MLIIYNEQVERRVDLAKRKLNTEKVSIFLTPDVLEELRQEAEQKGIGLSAYIRMIVLERKK